MAERGGERTTTATKRKHATPPPEDHQRLERINDLLQIVKLDCPDELARIEDQLRDLLEHRTDKSDTKRGT